MGEKSQPLVSVIIPVYNVERYLRQSLDCILGKTLTDFEAICVDNGSKTSPPRFWKNTPKRIRA